MFLYLLFAIGVLVFQAFLFTHWIKSKFVYNDQINLILNALLCFIVSAIFYKDTLWTSFLHIFCINTTLFNITKIFFIYDLILKMFTKK